VNHVNFFKNNVIVCVSNTCNFASLFSKTFLIHAFKRPQMKKIKNIIVPTDFSVTARNAYHYAKKLAESIDAAVTVVHVNEAFMPMNGAPILRDERESTEAVMESFIADEETMESWVMVQNKVKTRVMKGDLVEEIVELSKGDGTDLIVIGMTGLQDWMTKIVGSASIKIANQSYCPVLLVPHDAKWHSIDRLMYASDYHSATPKMIQNTIDFSLPFQSQLHFVHIEDSTGDTTKIIWDELFTPANKNLSFKIQSIYGEDKIEALKKYADANRINLMIFVSQHRGFWENLVHSSVTQNIAMASDIPIMVLHMDDVV
jgi:nucleotide-binding universal stress UspA family protein